jgi:hypothetical protein
MLRRSVLALSLLPAFRTFAEGTAIDAARRAAGDWLALVDRGELTASWNRASTSFKAAVTSEQWLQAASGVRTPLGALAQREERSVQFTKTLPGAPDGQYVLLQYQASFEKKASSVETVTVKLDADGQWRVTGYFIK